MARSVLFPLSLSGLVFVSHVSMLLFVQLPPEEVDFLKANSSQDLAAFVAVNDDISESFVKNAIK